MEGKFVVHLVFVQVTIEEGEDVGFVGMLGVEMAMRDVDSRRRDVVAGIQNGLQDAELLE